MGHFGTDLIRLVTTNNRTSSDISLDATGGKATAMQYYVEKGRR